MTIEQLSHFVEVCRCRSITQAADALLVSRQSISASIKKLENEFETVLLTRLATGVEPTAAGKTLYQYSRTLINDTAILKQAMLPYSRCQKPLKLCNINIAEPLMNIFGTKLYEILHDSFPDTYFNFQLAIVTAEQRSYTNADLSIILCPPPRIEKVKKFLPANHTLKILGTFPIYAWFSTESPLNQHSTLDINTLLRTANVCFLKNTFSGINFLNHYFDVVETTSVKKPLIIELIPNFINYIEKFGYYTIDLPLQSDHALIYSNIFLNHNVIAKQLLDAYNICVIYNRDTCENFYPLVADTISSLINPLS